MIKPQQHYFRKPLIFTHTLHDRLSQEVISMLKVLDYKYKTILSLGLE